METKADHGGVRVLVFAASMRAESLNARLAKLAASVLQKHGAKVDLATMKDFDGSSYDQDVETRDGLPAGARELHRRLEANDAIVIASPEYNASIPGCIKNAIDWVSRVK